MANNNDKFISRENAKTLWGYMIDLLTGKQNKLTFDETPTQSSDNPVKSGGIFTALAGKGTYSKPQNGIPKTDLENAVQTSLGLADSALQSETDPTVPSWAKQTNKPSYTQDEVGDGTTYKRVNQTEKDTWSGKQNALTTTQMQAVNSGITSDKVTQISTNQTNILSVADNVSVNQFSYTLEDLQKWNAGNWNGNVFTTNNIKFTVNSDMSITVSGTSTSGTAWMVLSTGIPLSGEYVLHGCPASGGASAYELQVTIASSDKHDYGNGVAISPNNNLTGAAIGVRVGTWNVTFKPVIVAKSLYDAGLTGWVQPSKQNYDLTQLEAEDRAALAEEIDAGAKNKFNPANIAELRNLATNGSDYSYVSTTTDTRTQCNFCVFSWNGNTKIDQLTKTDISANGKVVLYFTKTNTFNKISFGHSGQQKDLMIFYDVSDLVNGQSYVLSCNVTQYNPSVANFAFSNVMFCTSEAWKVSQNFVPYCRISKVITDLRKEIVGSTTLTNTGLEYYLESGAKYRITAFAEYGASNPLEIVICKSNGVVLGQESISPASGTTIGYVVAIGYLDARAAATVTLKARFASATTNYVGMSIEKL